LPWWYWRIPLKLQATFSQQQWLSIWFQGLNFDVIVFEFGLRSRGCNVSIFFWIWPWLIACKWTFESLFVSRFLVPFGLNLALKSNFEGKFVLGVFGCILVSVWQRCSYQLLLVSSIWISSTFSFFLVVDVLFDNLFKSVYQLLSRFCYFFRPLKAYLNADPAPSRNSFNRSVPKA